MSCPVRLARALERCAAAAGIALTIRQAEAVAWASATFAGARHEVCFEAIASDACDVWIGDLPEAELSVPGELIADLRIVRVARTAERAKVTIEVLTVEAT